jgi:hypothetical protein
VSAFCFHFNYILSSLTISLRRYCFPSPHVTGSGKKTKRMNSTKTFVINSALELLFLWRNMNTRCRDVLHIRPSVEFMLERRAGGRRTRLGHKRQTTFNMQRIYYSLASFYPTTFEYNKRLKLLIFEREKSESEVREK